MSRFGRPQIYSEKILLKARRYVNAKRPGKLYGMDEVIPTVEGLALAIGIHKDTIYEWIKQPEKKDFSDVVKELMSKQGMLLQNGGLSKRFDPKISTLILTKHGFKEKLDVTSDEKALVPSGEQQSRATKALQSFLGKGK